jgi:hypothetical protein
MLLLLPKCPACIAAYLSLWTGLGVANSVAGHLRFAVAGIFLVSLMWFFVERLRAAGYFAQRGARRDRRVRGDEQSV